jgi:hypothetical protein
MTDFPTPGVTPANWGAQLNTAIQERLDEKADDSDVTSALADKADLVGGVVPSSQLPALAITDAFPVASQAAMLALTAQKGDVAIRSDVNKSFILSTNSPSTLADWLELLVQPSVPLSLYDANTILMAVADNTPVALSVAASRILGRAASGDIDDLTAAQVWAILAASAGHPEVIMIAVSDETTAITTGTAKVTFRMPFAFTLTKVKASLTTASTSGNPAFDLNEAGASVFSTTLTIDATELTSETAATAAVISDPNLADDAQMTIDIDTAGTGAKGLKLYLIGTRA